MIMLIDHSEVVSVKEPDPRELTVLRAVFKTLAQPVYETQAQWVEKRIEAIIAQRILLGIATFVEASRDALVSASLDGGNPITVTSFSDLLTYVPEAVALDARMSVLVTARLKGDMPSAIMGSLGWSIQSDTALDGEIRNGFTPKQLYELGKIHQLNKVR